MDDIKVNNNPSLVLEIRKKISFFAILFIVLSLIIIALLSFNEAKEQQDNLLVTVSNLIKQNEKLLIDSLEMSTPFLLKNDEAIIVHSFKKSINKTRYKTILKKDAGLSTLFFNNQEWRVYIIKNYQQKDKSFFVGQRTEVRNEYAWNNCLSFFIPILLFIIIIILIINIQIKTFFKPINNIGNELANKKVIDFTHLSKKGIFIEVIPFFDAINLLLTKSNEYIQNQNTFIANAAHELRTPITALSLQVENLLNANKEESRSIQISIKQGFSRVRKMSGQLLDLARLDHYSEKMSEQISVLEIIKGIISSLHPIIEQKNIKLEVIAPSDIRIYSANGEIDCLIKNSIENAVKFTPNDCEMKIFLILSKKKFSFIVENFSKEISKKEIENIKKPFYKLNQRNDGSGLGLSICHKIADKMNGNLELKISENNQFSFIYTQSINDDETKMVL